MFTGGAHALLLLPFLFRSSLYALVRPGLGQRSPMLLPARRQHSALTPAVTPPPIILRLCGTHTGKRSPPELHHTSWDRQSSWNISVLSNETKSIQPPSEVLPLHFQSASYYNLPYLPPSLFLYFLLCHQEEEIWCWMLWKNMNLENFSGLIRNVATFSSSQLSENAKERLKVWLAQSSFPLKVPYHAKFSVIMFIFFVNIYVFNMSTK